jgi:hypothetical protein
VDAEREDREARQPPAAAPAGPPHDFSRANH